jgi:hypothetical protein
MSTKLTTEQHAFVQDILSSMKSSKEEWTTCRKSAQALYKKAGSTWGEEGSSVRISFNTAFAKVPQERLWATILESGRVPDPFVIPKSKADVKELFLKFNSHLPTWKDLNVFRPAEFLWDQEAAARKLIEEANPDGLVISDSENEDEDDDDDGLGFDTQSPVEIERFVENIRKRKRTDGDFLCRLSEKKRAAFEHYNTALKKHGQPSGKKLPSFPNDNDSEDESSSKILTPSKRKLERERKRKEDMESVMSAFLGMISKNSGNFGQNDDDFDTKSHKRANQAQRKFEQGRYVHLGMLVSESDPNFSSTEPSTEVTLSGLSSLRTKAKYVRPKTWSEFVLLFIRLMKGYICNGFASKAAHLFEYLEELTIQNNVGMCSIAALIAYDERKRSSSRKPFDWFNFDHRLFMIATTEFPKAVVPYLRGGENSNLSSFPSKNRDFTPKGGRASESVTVAQRTRNGACTSWAKDGCCKFERTPVGCKFSHWCLKNECQQDSGHRPDQCPHA